MCNLIYGYFGFEFLLHDITHRVCNNVEWVESILHRGFIAIVDTGKIYGRRIIY